MSTSQGLASSQGFRGNMLQEKQFKREIARKAGISEINSGLNSDSEGARRVNVFATVVEKISEEGKPYRSLVIDDGTGQIQLRFFDGSDETLFQIAQVGDFSIIIGKVRQYNDEKYIIPEIVKKLNVKWAEVRQLELKIMRVQPGKAEKIMENCPLDSDLVCQDKMKIYRTVKELDGGKGAEISDVIKMSGNINAETIIRSMIQSGDLFEVLPGKLKVLE